METETQKPTLEQIVAKICQQLTQIEAQIETINTTLRESK
jgi:hypothetical protein